MENTGLFALNVNSNTNFAKEGDPVTVNVSESFEDFNVSGVKVM